MKNLKHALSTFLFASAFLFGLGIGTPIKPNAVEIEEAHDQRFRYSLPHLFSPKPTSVLEFVHNSRSDIEAENLPRHAEVQIYKGWGDFLRFILAFHLRRMTLLIKVPPPMLVPSMMLLLSKISNDCCSRK
jgi:hypothetical protein